MPELYDGHFGESPNAREETSQLIHQENHKTSGIQLCPCPKHSMYVIFAYLDPSERYHPMYVKYAAHGCCFAEQLSNGSQRVVVSDGRTTWDRAEDGDPGWCARRLTVETSQKGCFLQDVIEQTYITYIYIELYYSILCGLWIIIYGLCRYCPKTFPPGFKSSFYRLGGFVSLCFSMSWPERQSSDSDKAGIVCDGVPAFCR